MYSVLDEYLILHTNSSGHPRFAAEFCSTVLRSMLTKVKGVLMRGRQINSSLVSQWGLKNWTYLFYILL